MPSTLCLTYMYSFKYIVMIRKSGHVCSGSLFPGLLNTPISPDTEIGSHTFSPD